MHLIKFFRRAAIFFAGICVLPGIAVACDTTHALRINVQSGTYEVYLNDAFLYAGNSSNALHHRSFTEWLVPKNNIVTVKFDGTDGEFSLIKGCLGQFPSDNFISQVKFTAAGSKTFSFDHVLPLDNHYQRADIAGDSGLMDAVKVLQDAARKGDVVKILSIHAPMLDEYKRTEKSKEEAEAFVAQVQDYMRYILTENDIVIADTLIAKPIMGGRVYQVLDRNKRSPIAVSSIEDDGSYSWNSGTFWARFNGEWQLIAN